VACIFAVNASWLPALDRASSPVVLSVDGGSSASSAWRSAIASAPAMATIVSPSRACGG